LPESIRRKAISQLLDVPEKAMLRRDLRSFG